VKSSYSIISTRLRDFLLVPVLAVSANVDAFGTIGRRSRVVGRYGNVSENSGHGRNHGSPGL
jgi:hypothetical protein